MKRTTWWVIDFIKYLYSLFITTLWYVTKGLMRRTTNLCELQRSVYGELPGCRRTKLVESSLNYSRNPDVRNAMDMVRKSVTTGSLNSRGTRKSLMINAATRISVAKGISLKAHSKFVTGLADCIELISAYESVVERIKMELHTPYSSDNPEHEKMLMSLWTQLKAPEVLTGRMSAQWETLGFQGRDPATDFRGGGILSLKAYLYIACEHTHVAKQLLELACSPVKYEYPLACAIIQVVAMVARMWEEGLVKSHFYNRFHIILTVEDRKTLPFEEQMLLIFFELVLALVIDLNNMWIEEKPLDLRSYPPIFSKFETKVQRSLKQDDCCYLMATRIV